MLRRDASSLFRSVLVLSAVGTACGGAVESKGLQNDPGDGSSSSTSSSGSTSSSSSTSSSGGSTSSSSGSTSSSGGSTSSTSSGGSSSGNSSCTNGTTPMSSAYCCAPGSTCTGGGGDGDAGTGSCAIDCTRVCADVAPNVTGGFNSCYVTSQNQITYWCGSCGLGRLPSDTKACPLGDTLAERLARQAYYEGVSVVAFERLVAALVSANAPESLVARARSAAEDEARHAAIFRDLAAAHGASTRPVVTDEASPSLFDLAVENATEGCVRETLGAVITLHQAAHAGSAAVRAAYAAICDDEAEHAALSWELKAWFDTQLTAEQRAEVDRAHGLALALARREALERPDALGLELGLPEAARARRMLDLVVDAMAA